MSQGVVRCTRHQARGLGLSRFLGGNLGTSDSTRSRAAKVAVGAVLVAIIIAGGLGIAATIPGGLFGGSVTVSAADRLEWVSLADGNTPTPPTFVGCNIGGTTDSTASGSAVVTSDNPSAPNGNLVLLTINAPAGDVCTFQGALTNTGSDQIGVSDLALYESDGGASDAPSDNPSDPTSGSQLTTTVASQPLNSGSIGSDWTDGPFTVPASSGDAPSFSSDIAVQFSVTIPSDASGEFSISGWFDASAGGGPVPVTSPPSPTLPPPPSPSTAPSPSAAPSSSPSPSACAGFRCPDSPDPGASDSPAPTQSTVTVDPSPPPSSPPA